jgi:hypothetical protein
MAAIFNADAEEHDGGVARDGGHAPAKKIVPAMANAPAKSGASSAPGADVGRLNFLASAPATVLLDDQKLGTTPMKGVPLKPGTYKLQFQCGAGAKSDPRTLEVLPFSETDPRTCADPSAR